MAKNTQNPRRKKPKKYQLFANFTETNCENFKGCSKLVLLSAVGVALVQN